MGLFDFWRKKQMVEAAPQVPEKPPRHPGLAFVPYSGGMGSGRAEFESVPVDLTLVQKAYATDSYVRQAIDKYIELIFKSKWDLIGTNQKAVEYVRQRFAAMSAAMAQPHELVFIEAAENLVKYGNAFIAKVRGGPEYLLGLKAVPAYKKKHPVVGYVCLSPLTMEIARDKSGYPIAYQQNIPGMASKSVVYRPSEIIHIHYKKETGMAFGVPFIWPAVNDVRLLRYVEEMVSKLIYKDLFPYVHWKVGSTDSPGAAGTDDEVEIVRQKIESMTEDGIFVTTERHELEVLGVEGQALDAEKYLRYFEQRVFTGLGVSETQMGRAGVSSRSSADSQVDQFYDRIHAFQMVLETFINFHMINEILLEGGYNPYLNTDEQVAFRFREIDLASLTKRMNIAVFKWSQAITTLEETRVELGLDADVDISRLRPMLFGNMADTADAENRMQPENQHGKKTSGTRPRNSAALDSDVWQVVDEEGIEDFVEGAK